MSVEGSGIPVDAWNACLVPTEARHDFCGDATNHVLVIDLDPWTPALNSPEYAEYQHLAPLFERPRALTLDNQLQSLVQLCAREFDNASANHDMQRHFAAGILHCLAERLERNAPQPVRHGLSPETIRRYVMENLHRKITVQDLAQVACLSVSRFNDLFRELTGLTPHQFLLQIRLEQAAQLLASSTLSVNEISFRTGFSSQSALANALRKHRGITPSALRAARVDEQLAG